MTVPVDLLLGALGWGGSALLVVSLLQSKLTRLRVLNLISCVLLVVYNIALSVWPMAAMNAALLVINGFYLVREARKGTPSAASSPQEDLARQC